MLLRQSEVERAYRLSKTTLHRWLKDGKLTDHRTVGGHRRYESAEIEFLLSVSDGVPVLMQFEVASTNFFRRATGGDAKTGFPRCKRKKRSRMCFHLEPAVIAANGTKVRIPKSGWLNMHQAIRFVGRLVGIVCIRCAAGRRSASFSVEKQERKAVGVDVGSKNLAVRSDRTVFDNSKSFYRLEKLLAREQRIHKRIADLRANATHHVSAYVAVKYDGVAIEDLNVRGMSRNHNFTKSIVDANFAELPRQVVYKMAWAGGEVRQVDRFFPSSRLCRVCGLITSELTLADREWTCACGTRHNKDLNAAINLAIECFAEGRRSLRVEDRVQRGSPMKRELW